MASTISKRVMMLALALTFAIPSFASVRKSKLRIVTSVPVAARFRQPGEKRVAALPRKKIRRHREAPMEVVVQAHRQEPMSPRERQRQVEAVQRPEPRSVVIRQPMREQLPNFSLVPRSTTKNNLSIELLGRGGLYSFDYDRALGRSVSMGLGFSYSALRLNADDFVTVNATVVTVPIYGNFYFNSDLHHRFMGTGGITMVSVKAEAEATTQNELSPEAREMALQFVNDLDLKANASVVLPLPVGGAGYEYKSSGGFLARAALYVVYVGEVQPWAGVAVGSHF